MVRVRRDDEHFRGFGMNDEWELVVELVFADQLGLGALELGFGVEASGGGPE